MSFHDHFLKIASLLALLALSSACKSTEVTIDPNDGSNPNVTFFVKNSSGSWVATNAADYGNSTAQKPLQIRAVVEDPSGVKSNDLRVHDNIVDTAYCGGGLHPGAWVVDDLPGPSVKSSSGAGGKAPTKCTTYLTIEGILPLVAQPIGVSQTCYPANNTSIALRCIGKNWSSNAANSTTTKTFVITFRF